MTELFTNAHALPYELRAIADVTSGRYAPPEPARCRVCGTLGDECPALSHGLMRPREDSTRRAYRRAWREHRRRIRAAHRELLTLTNR